MQEGAHPSLQLEGPPSALQTRVQPGAPPVPRIKTNADRQTPAL